MLLVSTGRATPAETVSRPTSCGSIALIARQVVQVMLASAWPVWADSSQILSAQNALTATQAWLAQQE